MRMIACFGKQGVARHVAHLDLLRTMQRALRRAELPIKYSEGFNPHPLLAFGSAMSVGMESTGEYLDVTLSQDMSEEEFFLRAREQMPPGITLLDAHAVSNRYPALMQVISKADYKVWLSWTDHRTAEELFQSMKSALDAPLLAMKKGKKGMKEVDLAPMVLKAQCEVEDIAEAGQICLSLQLVHASSGALNPYLLMPVWLGACGATEAEVKIARTALWAGEDGEQIPVWALPEKEKQDTVREAIEQ